mgnify:FL=1|jgi:uncharacterized protein YdhG (YjbR/CyaY superfamily)|tara:strand:+ start:40 stop:471 length:432 start_codon:yes stop_codon:yes gene_type:complete
MQSKANTVKQYLNELPNDRKKAISIVRQTILENLPEGYDEVMNWGMITYEVPLETYPNTYNGKSLMYAALASQKNHMAVYLMGCYMVPEVRNEFEKAYKKSGKRFDAGKSCIRFKKIDDLPLDLLGKTIASMDVNEFIELVEK